MNIESLKSGDAILHSEGGNSMTPIIKSRQSVLVQPIVDHRTLEKGDIVLAKVGRQRYMHLISATKPGYVQISNNHGHVNGWTAYENVYGIITHIGGTARKNSQYPSV